MKGSERTLAASWLYLASRAGSSGIDSCREHGGQRKGSGEAVKGSERSKKGGSERTAKGSGRKASERTSERQPVDHLPPERRNVEAVHTWPFPAFSKTLLHSPPTLAGVSIRNERGRQQF